ncbi:ABC-2 type transport system permease protein [Bacillus sp. TE9106W]
MYKYAILSKITLNNNLAYSFNVLTSALATLISLVAYRQIWGTLLDGTNLQNQSMSLIDMTTYITISMILGGLYATNDIIYEISNKIRSGDIILDMQKPWDYQFTIFAKSIGKMLSNILTVVLPVMVIVILFMPVHLPTSWSTWMVMMISILFAIVINFSIWFIVGLLSFVFVEVWGLEILFSLIITFLSGKVIPMSYFPSSIINIIQWLPFRGIYDIPLSIITNVTDTNQYGDALLFQAAWLFVLVVLGRLMLKCIGKSLITVGG